MNQEFEQVVKAVASAMDLTVSQILSNRRFPETIDARWITVYLLNDRGFYTAKIAVCMGMTPRNVTRILAAVRDRLSIETKLRRNLDAARKYLSATDAKLI